MIEKERNFRSNYNDPLDSSAMMFKETSVGTGSVPTKTGIVTYTLGGRRGTYRRTKEEKANLHCEHCTRPGHDISECFELHGYPDWFKKLKEHRSVWMANQVGAIKELEMVFLTKQRSQINISAGKYMQAAVEKLSLMFTILALHLQICSYAPDLAKTISGLIMSSHDSNFKHECFSLLGLQPHENEEDVIEKCIKDKIISVTALNDTNNWRSREASALFEDDAQQEKMDCGDEEYEGDDTFDILRIKPSCFGLHLGF